MNTRKSIFFSQSSVRIQLQDTKGVKSQSENRKLDEETLVSRKVYLFHPDFSPSSILQATWIHTYLKLLRLPLSGGQPSRLTNSFVEYHRFDSLMSHFFYFKMKDKTTNMLHNLCYVLFFVIRFTNGFFDTFNCWDHCILKVLCVRHWHIFPRTTADRCIQVIKCF